MELAVGDKHTSLQHFNINYRLKKFYGREGQSEDTTLNFLMSIYLNSRVGGGVIPKYSYEFLRVNLGVEQ